MLKEILEYIGFEKNERGEWWVTVHTGYGPERFVARKEEYDWTGFPVIMVYPEDGGDGMKLSSFVLLISKEWGDM